MRAAEVYDAVADALDVPPEDRTKLLPSGMQQVYKNRIGWAHTAATAVCILAIVWEAHASRPPELTAKQAAARVSQVGGRVLVVLYSSACPRSRSFLVALNDFVRKDLHGQARVLAFALDKDPGKLATYLADVRFAFETVRILPWKPGELAGAMTPAGVRVPKTSFDLPLVAIVDGGRGQSLGQWEAARPPLLRELSAMLRQP